MSTRAQRAIASAVALVAMFAGASAASAGADSPGSAAGSTQPLVLVVSETRGFVHASIPTARRTLAALGRRSAAYDVRLLERANQLTPARLRGAAAVVFANTTGELRMNARQRAQLLRFIRSGGGFVGTHSATDTFHRWPAYARMIGARFDSHPNVGVGRVVIEDREHPATRTLPAAIRINEEFYFFDRNPRARARVLARLDLASFGGSPREDRPLMWCRHEGRGRVFYDALGHNAITWTDRRHRAILDGALRWAVGADSATCQ